MQDFVETGYFILQKIHLRAALKQGQAFVLVVSCSHSQALHVAPGHAWNQEGPPCDLDEELIQIKASEKKVNLTSVIMIPFD